MTTTLPRCKRLWAVAGGFWRQAWLKQALNAAGYTLTPFPWPRPDAVVVWGRRPVARRGRAAARLAGLPVLTVEDAFLRSVHAGPGEPAAGLLIDDIGIHHDGAHPSRLEQVCATAARADAALIARARGGIAFLRRYGLSKYNAVPRGSGTLPKAGFVLVADQLRGDAAAGASEDYQRMLAAAIAENPGLPIWIRPHPAGPVQGFVDPADPRCAGVLADGLNPWDVLESAARVYCVSSQLGFDAILAGHRPRVFGQPFYAGWGLSDDEMPNERRSQVLTREHLFAAAMIEAPHWFDLVLGRSCSFEQAAAGLLARASAEWAKKQVVFMGARRWKRRFLRRYLGDVVFSPGPNAVSLAALKGAPLAVWASAETPQLAQDCARAGVALWRVEDGFLRSAGLGADLFQPASLVVDRSGIYYDPSRPSDLEALIAASTGLDQSELQRAATLRRAICDLGISKYNTGDRQVKGLPDGRRIILVPGQVEDDASIRLGCAAIRTNAALLDLVRAENPDAFVIYKPHPDVVAGLRRGSIEGRGADLVLPEADVATLLSRVDEVWTMTSLTGFEALLRGRRVVVLGMPFYAGWGLTEDRGMTCPRRQARVSLDGLVHAALIDYPLYRDPVTGLAATPEQIVALLAASARPRPGIAARLQRLAAKSGLWRR